MDINIGGIEPLEDANLGLQIQDIASLTATSHPFIVPPPEGMEPSPVEEMGEHMLPSQFGKAHDTEDYVA